MSHNRSRWSIFIVAVALIIALSGVGLPALIAAPDPTPTAYPLPVKTAVLSDDPPVIVLTAVPSSDQTERPGQTLIAETAHYRFLVESGDFTADTIPDLADRGETVYADVLARLSGFADVGLAEPLPGKPLTVVIARPTGPVDAGCTVRGIAMYGDRPQITVFADSTVSEAYFWGVLSHETAHMIHAESLAGFARHQPLTEGLATWNSASYWAAWMGADSLDDLVRSYLASGAYLPLYANYDLAPAYNGSDCLHYRDILYSEWASFTGYLIDEYGFGRYGALMDSAPPETRVDDDLGRITVIRPADFEGIYGLALNQLEARWLAWLHHESSMEIKSVQPDYTQQIMVAHDYDSPVHLEVWWFDDRTGNLQRAAEIEGASATYIVDKSNQIIYFLQRDRSSFIGPSRIIRNDWATGEQNVVFEQPNMASIRSHHDDNKLVIWYYDERHTHATHLTPVRKCVLDLNTQTCQDMRVEFSEEQICCWIWIDDTHALRLDKGWYRIQQLDSETGSITSYTLGDQESRIMALTTIPDSDDLLFIASLPNENEFHRLNNDYHFMRLNPRTFEVTRLAHVFTHYLSDPNVSPGGKYLQYLQYELAYRRADLGADHVQVIDLETGDLILSSPLVVDTPTVSGLQLIDTTFRWASDSARLLVMAEFEDGEERYIAQIDIHTGAISLLATLPDPDLDFYWR